MSFAAPLAVDADDAQFRAVARRCLANGIPPADVSFTVADQSSLFAALPETGADRPLLIPRSFADLMRDAICNSAADRFALLYDVLWRIVRGERRLAENHADPSVARLHAYAHNVRRDIHKMHAFLRFREQKDDGQSLFTAWFEPQHFILRRAIPFFVDRFSQMNWLIATPIGTANWDRRELEYGPPMDKPAATTDEVLDGLWLTYYKTTFNPARLRKKAMLAQMPKHYWRNMPETDLVPAMIAGARPRVEAMEAQAPMPPPRFATKLRERPVTNPEATPTAMASLKADIAVCRRCPLHCGATQAVAGEGPADAPIMLVGEQPGDQEDLQGRPFVGPAGQLLDKALGEAGLARSTLYVTNAVKHFKYEPRGKRRIHQKPNTGEIQKCKWWLDREIEIVQPRLIVALGATAAQALSGHAVSVTKERGPTMFGKKPGFITVHPSYLLRLPDAQKKAEEYARFVSDLRHSGQANDRDA
jgi:DNA polymerase